MSKKHPTQSDLHPAQVSKLPGNVDQQGQQANTKQNTTHQGYQQDR